MLLNFSDTFLLIVCLIIFIWIGAITFLLIRLLKTFTKITKGVSDKDLKTILEDILAEIKQGNKTDDDLLKKVDLLKIEASQSLQKVGLIRYNPFGDTGGNQSFVLAILDGNDTGLVMTSLHSREATRVFSKPVKEGKEDGFEFSKEEIQAILLAQKKAKSK